MKILTWWEFWFCLAMWAVVGALPLLAGGCLSYAGKHPGFVGCVGKGNLTGSGQGTVLAGYGGSGLNSFSITGDCGDGFYFYQGQTPPPKLPQPVSGK